MRREQRREMPGPPFPSLGSRGRGEARSRARGRARREGAGREPYGLALALGSVVIGLAVIVYSSPPVAVPLTVNGTVTGWADTADNWTVTVMVPAPSAADWPAAANASALPFWTASSARCRESRSCSASG